MTHATPFGPAEHPDGDASPFPREWCLRCNGKGFYRYLGVNGTTMTARCDRCNDQPQSVHVDHFTLSAWEVEERRLRGVNAR